MQIISSLLSDGKDCIMEPELIFMYTLTAYDIHGRLNIPATCGKNLCWFQVL